MKLSTFIKIGFGISVGYSIGKATLYITEKSFIILADLALLKLENKLLIALEERENKIEEKK